MRAITFQCNNPEFPIPKPLNQLMRDFFPFCQPLSSLSRFFMSWLIWHVGQKRKDQPEKQRGQEG